MQELKKDLYNFYDSQIQENFVPYWNEFVDEEYGGILNCINNYGDEKLNDNKFTWSQGRYLWILAKLYELSEEDTLTKIDQEDIRKQMDKTYEFITKYCIDENYVCYYLLDRKGNPLLDEKSGRYDASIFADCFAIIGISQYVRVTNNKSELTEVNKLYDSILKRIESNDYVTEPYSTPKGYISHSVTMNLLLITHEYINLLKHFKEDYSEELKRAQSYVDTIFNEFYDDGLIREFVSNDENYETRMLDRHINPGHTLEDLWFIAEFLIDYGELDQYIDRLSKAAIKTFDLGWDEKYGGLLRFVDKKGKEIKGEHGGSSYEDLILDTHDMKLWWPHSEILYLFILLYKLTNDSKLKEKYHQSHEYVFDTFPNKEIGEWVQIRKRDGTPEEKLVALPVKDPFHILRNFIKIVELLRGV